MEAGLYPSLMSSWILGAEKVGQTSTLCYVFFTRAHVMYGFLRGLSTGVFLRGCAWMSVPDNNTENHEVVLRELSWLPGNKLARFSAAETLEPAPVNLENVTQKLHSMKTPPGKTQSRRVSQ